MANNKVHFGLSKLYYAVLTEGTDSEANSYGTPVAIPGAVSIDIQSNSSDNTFYADNVAYYKTFANNGYTGTLEVALIPDQMLLDVWGMTQDATSKVIYEKTGVQPKAIALLFQVEGDQDAELNALYRVVPTSKPTAGSETIGEETEPVPQTFDFEALPLVTGPAYQLGLIKARTSAETPAATKTGWFNTVNIPAA